MEKISLGERVEVINPELKKAMENLSLLLPPKIQKSMEDSSLEKQANPDNQPLSPRNAGKDSQMGVAK